LSTARRTTAKFGRQPLRRDTQPRINDLPRGRISRFSLDPLVNIAAALGRRVHVEHEVA
jgi:hypothetical protein